MPTIFFVLAVVAATPVNVWWRSRGARKGNAVGTLSGVQSTQTRTDGGPIAGGCRRAVVDVAAASDREGATSTATTAVAAAMTIVGVAKTVATLTLQQSGAQLH